MRRGDETMKDADAEIGFLYASERKLKKLTAKIREIDALLDGYGVNSPQIRSKEEAKYQRGTKIFTDMPLLELFVEQDKLQTEFDTINAACLLIRERLSMVKLSKADERLLYFVYVKRYQDRTIAERMHCSRTAVQKRHDRILKEYSEL